MHVLVHVLKIMYSIYLHVLGTSTYNDVQSSLHYKSHTGFNCMLLVCGTQHLEMVSMKIL